MRFRRLALVLFFAAVPVTAVELAGRASVIDGDTIEIHGQRIPLYGIDAPESAQQCERKPAPAEAEGKSWPCGRRAAFALADHIGARTVTCTPKDRDRYGRIVAVCFAGGEDVNAWMVRQGWAIAYRHYSLDYVAAEDAARQAGAGIWAGAFTPPWEWRHGQRPR